MDELVDILDDKGNPTGETALKSEAHRKAYFHPTVHVWFYNKQGQILLQQRGKNKETHPLLWDVSVAGHVGAGEHLETAAVREVFEEIGLTIEIKDLEKIGVFKSVQRLREDLTDCEFHHTYVSELLVDLQELKKQDSEVADLALFPLTRFAEETWGMANLKKYVPHGVTYYQTIVKTVKSRLQ
jgi:isopentenyldiphosphate isomerase